MTAGTQTPTIRVLVVDDSEFFAEMTAETLTEEHDLRATSETSAGAALEYLDETPVDCIVSDYEMPGMDGIEFLNAVREDHPDLPFILLTGRGDETVASEAIAAGVADYLLKLEVVEDEQYGRLANRIENVVSQYRAQAKYAQLVANSPDLIAHVSEAGEILAANPALAAFVDADREALAGRTLSDVLGEVGEDRLARGREAIAAGEPTHTEDAVDDRHFHNIFVPTAIHSERNSFQLVSREITERKERERQLERQNERLEEFASVVSHDLRNPLTVAESSLDLLEPADEREAEQLERAARSLARMEAIVDDVLTLARQGQTVDGHDAVDLGQVARETWAVVETDGSRLEVADAPTIDADESRLRNILSNLVGNAVEHNDDPVTVEIGGLGDGFYVADDGSGFDGSANGIFDLGHSTDEDGTGMGLTIVQRVAEAHGWEVDATERDDGGVRVEVRDVAVLD